MAKLYNASQELSSPPSRPPACGNRMCDLCPETRCRMLRREDGAPPSPADAPEASSSAASATEASSL